MNYKTLIVLDTIDNKLIQQSLELIACADNLTEGDLSRTLLLVPGEDVTGLSESISKKYGIDTAAVEHKDFKYPNPELSAAILSGIAGEYRPETIIFTHTVRNCQTAAKLSILLKTPSVTAIESFTRENNGYVYQRSIFNGKLKEHIRVSTDLQILTILPGAYNLDEDKIPYNSGATSVVKKYTNIIKGYDPISLSPEIESDVKLEDADVIVSAGRGISKEENLELIRETASIFTNSAIGASRPVCDQRWLPLNHQVGITGKTVTPKLYIACGISGSQQHIAGMKNSQCIVAINKDPNAAIFSAADYIVVEDIITFLPVLVAKYRERFK